MLDREVQFRNELMTRFLERDEPNFSMVRVPKSYTIDIVPFGTDIPAPRIEETVYRKTQYVVTVSSDMSKLLCSQMEDIDEQGMSRCVETAKQDIINSLSGHFYYPYKRGEFSVTMDEHDDYITVLVRLPVTTWEKVVD